MSHPFVNHKPVVGRFAWLMTGLFGLTACSQVYAQVIHASTTLKEARKVNRFEVTRKELAHRGDILSSDGQVLAQSQDQFEFSLDLTKVPHVPGFYVEIANAAGVSGSDIASAVERKKKRIEWSRPLDDRQAESVSEVRTKWRADGVSLARETRRIYPLGESFGSILGTLSETEPDGGIEKTMHDTLAGQDGVKIGLVDRSGAFLPTRMFEGTKEKVEGKPVQLTLDADLQTAAMQYVREAVEANQATSGIAIVMDPHTGDIQAMANWPSADPASGKPILGFNQNYSEVYEPGSTFKILTLAKALDMGVTQLEDTINCTGEFHFGKSYRVRCDEHHGHRGHGVIDSELAIAKSCNVRAAQWALAVKYPNMVQYIQQLGLTKKTDVGVTHEVAGLFDMNEVAKQLQIANVGFGQSISCTPLGLASAFSMIGNGGIRMQPRLIKLVGDKATPVRESSRIVTKQTADSVLHLMESVIQSDAGTGKSLRIPGYRLAGKTGTAQKIGAKNGGHVSSFIGFVPAVNPQAMILVMIDDPRGAAYYGASVAGPVFRRLAEDVIRIHQITPDDPVAQVHP